MVAGLQPTPITESSLFSERSRVTLLRSDLQNVMEIRLPMHCYGMGGQKHPRQDGP